MTTLQQNMVHLTGTKTVNLKHVVSTEVFEDDYGAFLDVRTGVGHEIVPLTELSREAQLALIARDIRKRYELALA